MSDGNWEGFSLTLCEVLKYDFEDAINQRRSTKGTDKEEFYAGYIAAFHHLFTLIQEKSESSEIPMSKLSLEAFKEEDFLI